MDYSLPGSSVYGDSPGKNTGVGCHALHQGIFPTQGSNPGPPALQVDSLQTEPPGNPSLNVSKALNSLRIFASVKENKKALKLGIPWWSSG